MADYSYLSAEPQPDPSLPQLGTEMLASFVPGLGQVQALRDYLRAGKSGDKLGQILSALGTVPGVGAITKASLLLPAMLRKPKHKILNENLSMIHAAMPSAFANMDKLPHNLRTPSLSIIGPKSAAPLGMDWNELGSDLDLGLSMAMFVNKPGRLDPAENFGKIWPSDAATSTTKGYVPLSERQAMMEKDTISAFKESEQVPYEGFKDYIARNAKYADRGPAAEAKLYGYPELSPRNFAGVVYDPQAEHIPKLLKLLRDRGLPAEAGSILDPVGNWDKMQWLQQRSLK